MDALASGTDEGRCKAAKAPGRCQATYDPVVSEWGNPALCEQGKPAPCAGGEPGELKHLTYPEEKKSNEIPLVAESESG